METSYIDIRNIEPNNGQIEGLPRNPRKIDEGAIEKLVKSIRQDKQMLEMRPLIVYPIGDTGKFVVIGGNMRLEALKRMGEGKTPCIIIPKNTPVEALKRILVKDNANFGQWDWDELKTNWNAMELSQWQIIEFKPMNWQTDSRDEEKKEVQGRNKKSAWKSERQAGESVCDLTPKTTVYQRGDALFLASYKKSEQGIPLSEIKTDEYLPIFADNAIQLIRGIINMRCTDDWAIVTTPRRRHKDWNFASEVCKRIEMQLGIEYIRDIAEAKNRHRVNPEFSLLKCPEQRNIIIYDDILTTGSTIRAMRDLLQGKNVMVIIGINNN